MRSKKLMALFVAGVEDILRDVYVKTFWIHSAGLWIYPRGTGNWGKR